MRIALGSRAAMLVLVVLAAGYVLPATAVSEPFVQDVVTHRDQRGIDGLRLHLHLLARRYGAHDPAIEAAVRMSAAGAVVLEVSLEDPQGKAVRRETLEKVAGPLAGLTLSRAGVAPGKYQLKVASLGADGKALAEDAAELSIDAALQPPGAAPGRVRIRTWEPRGLEQASWPITTGVPLPKGALGAEQGVRLVDAQGQPVPASIRPLATWGPGGSIKWLRLDYQVPLAGPAVERFLEFGEGVKAPAAQPSMVRQDEKAITVDTGKLRFVVSRQRNTLIERAWLDLNNDGQYGESELLVQAGDDAGPYLHDEAGRRYTGTGPTYRAEVEVDSPLRSVIRLSGWYHQPGAPAGDRGLCQYIIRIWAYRDQPFVRVFQTFIFTEDSEQVRLGNIGTTLTLAEQNTQGRFGGHDELPPQSSAYLYVPSFDEHSVEIGAGAARRVLARGTQAPGWLHVSGGRGGVTMAVRDLAQNYPKELETEPGRVTFHFWPKHPAPPPQRSIDAGNVHQLWSLHEGELMNLQVTPEYDNYPYYGGHPKEYFNPSVSSNAMGTAKTHELLLSFTPPDTSTQAISALNAAFQQDVHAMADPEWMCASQAFGRIHPRDPQRFPEVEAIFPRKFDYWVRLATEVSRGYGMWNYGDVHEYWDMTKLVPRNQAMWKGYHHLWSRVPWLLYARSGDPRYLTWGRRSAAHLIDVDRCHYAPPASEGQPWVQDRSVEGWRRSHKIQGSIGRYKNLVHWDEASAVGDYNNASDFMLWCYYLTGNRRGPEALGDWIKAVHEHASPGKAGRPAAATLDAIARAYEHAPDPRLLELINQYTDGILKAQDADGSQRTYGTENAPWMHTVYALTRRDDIVESCIRWARAPVPPRLGRDWPVALALEHEDDFAMADTSMRYMFVMARAMLDEPASLFDGGPDNRNNSFGWVFQSWPHLMVSLARRPEVYEKYRLLQEGSAKWTPRDGGPMRVFLRQDQDGPFTLTIRNARTAPTAVKVTRPDGRETVLSTQVEGSICTATVEADGLTGVYVVNLEQDRRYETMLPISDLPGEVYPLYAAEHQFEAPNACIVMRIPAGTTRATIGGRAATRGFPFTVAAYDAAARKLGAAQGRVTAESQSLASHLRHTIAVSPESTDQFWTLWSYSDTRQLVSFEADSPAFVPVFSLSAARWFDPGAPGTVAKPEE